MANYREWNQALVLYFSSGVPRGTRVYLSVDDEVLERIGRKFNQELKDGRCADDFRRAVKKEVVSEGRVSLGQLQGCYSEGSPKGVAFLTLMVLAANDMAEEEEISDDNYFRRLQAVLSLPTSEKGRPLGMKFAKQAEEPLWKEWNHWLMRNGFVPSAHQGRGGRTYINYPISQSLLRSTDKNRVVQLFYEKQWKARWDAMTLFASVRREAQGLPTHLKQLLVDNRERYEAIAEAIHEVYHQWLDEGSSIEQRQGLQRVRTWSRQLFAGLYRTEDPFIGEVNYYLYPREARGRQVESIQILYKDNVHQLINERPGWYFPLNCPLKIGELEAGAKYLINDTTDLEFLILPSRDFWILIPNPDDPDTGLYATWGQPLLGTKFILLCKKELLVDINRLRDELLIKWDGEPIPLCNSNWVELHQCMVISLAWNGVFIRNQELKDALQPSARLSISFSGGLRVPQQSAWLEGHNPQITVFGFYPTVKLQITRLLDNSSIFEQSQSTNTPVSVKFPSSGDYVVKASCGGESIESFVKILDWSRLGIEKPQRCEITSISPGNNICGSVIQPVSTRE